MRRAFLCIAVMLASSACVHAGADKHIEVSGLPAPAQQFLSTYFPNAAPAYVKVDNEFMSKNYEVMFSTGEKVEFNSKGTWTEVDCDMATVPAGIVPKPIGTYVMTKHPERKIVSISRDRHDYEVELDTGLDLKFDLKFNLIEVD